MLFEHSPGLEAMLAQIEGFGPAAAAASSLPPSVVPDISADDAGAMAGLEFDALSFGSLISELDTMEAAADKPKAGAPPPPPPPATPRAANKAAVLRPVRGEAHAGGDDALARLFPKAVLQLEPVEYQRVKKERLHLLTAAQQRQLTAARRRARNCVYAEDKRQRRIADKRQADTVNADLTEQNRRLREENARLRLELAAAAADQP